MGASESLEVVWDLNRPNRFYFAGETVIGTIYVTPTKFYSSQNLFLTYAVQSCTYKNTRSKNPTLNRRWILSQVKPLVRDDVDVNTEDLPRTLEFQFKFQLPVQVPPSLYCKKKIALVTHLFQISKDGKLKEFKQPNLTETPSGTTLPIIVYPRVNISSLPSVNGGAFKVQNKKICLSVALKNSGIVPGNDLDIQFDIQNHKQNSLSSLTFTLIQNYTVGETSGERMIAQTFVPGIDGTNIRSIRSEAKLAVPRYPYPPSSSFNGGIGESEISLNVNYSLKAALVIHGLFNSILNLTFPVVVGTEPLKGSGGILRVPLSGTPSFREPSDMYYSSLGTLDLENFTIDSSLLGRSAAPKQTTSSSIYERKSNSFSEIPSVISETIDFDRMLHRNFQTISGSVRNGNSPTPSAGNDKFDAEKPNKQQDDVTKDEITHSNEYMVMEDAFPEQQKDLIDIEEAKDEPAVDGDESYPNVSVIIKRIIDGSDL